MKTLEKRLKDSLLISTLPTCSDYGMLLKRLSFILDKPIDELREGKGYFTYGEWSQLFLNLEL